MGNMPGLRLVLIACSALVAAGCTSLSVEAPTGVNLSGHWIINTSLSDVPPPRGNRALRTRKMTIEQDASSMGIDYANAAYRDITWGKRNRAGYEIEAGWEQDLLIVRSKAQRRSVTETYRLDQRNNRLHLRVEFSGGASGSKLAGRAFNRVFDRVSN
jgi:hypothetical protein